MNEQLSSQPLIDQFNKLVELGRKYDYPLIKDFGRTCTAVIIKDCEYYDEDKVFALIQQIKRGDIKQSTDEVEKEIHEIFQKIELEIQKLDTKDQGDWIRKIQTLFEKYKQNPLDFLKEKIHIFEKIMNKN